jgi:parvulin-like peptidyl-prolyl isomerase
MATSSLFLSFTRGRRAALLLALSLAAGCQKADKGNGPTGGATGSTATATATGSGSAAAAAVPQPPAAPAEDIDSKDILTRTETTPEVLVKHVLLGWKDLSAAYRGHMDPRAAARTNADAAKLARETLAKLKADPGQIDALSKDMSEDPGSKSGDPYTVKAETPFVPEFKQLALRLKLGEAGIVKTNYGYHVIERVAPPPPDPLESAEILARPAPVEVMTVQTQHVLIGWKDAPGASRSADPRAAQRTKADADKLAGEILGKVRAGGDMAALMKEFSEDPGSKDTGKVYEVGADTPFVEPYKNMAMRLKIGEAGLVKSPFGWHVIKRLPPPPPDSLESADILKREPATAKAKVKHILLGWTEVHASDERGTKRSRADLEKLVKATMAKLAKGEKIEPLMAELSEDPGSAKSGTSYDVTPEAGLVAPFKNLSLRLKVGEVGAVKSSFGIHIIQRTE